MQGKRMNTEMIMRQKEIRNVEDNYVTLKQAKQQLAMMKERWENLKEKASEIGKLNC